MKAVVILMLVLVWANVSPFPSDMYHTRDPEEFQDVFEGNGYQVREIPDPKVIKTALADLDPWPCDENENTIIHELRDFGRVAVKGHTYTEAHHRGGKYYATTESYDHACMCPLVYKAIWEPHRGRQRLESHEQRGGHVADETTEIHMKTRFYFLIFDEVYNSITHRGENTLIEPLINITDGGDPQALLDLRARMLHTRIVALMGQLSQDPQRAHLSDSQRVRRQNIFRWVPPMFRKFSPTGFLILWWTDAVTQMKMIDYVVTTTTTLFFYLNASTLNNTDTVRPGGGEKTLRSSRLPPPKYMLSRP